MTGRGRRKWLASRPCRGDHCRVRIDMKVTGGVVSGGTDGDLAVFRGIPYAALPVRFGEPQPVAAWEGAREATEFGPPPPQSGVFGMDALGEPGDDWLTVNVWSRDLDGRLPVMVWIQGGAYMFGTSGLPEYDGSNLAHGGVVVVTFNYRVGLEGFGCRLVPPGDRAERARHLLHAQTRRRHHPDVRRGAGPGARRAVDRGPAAAASRG